MTARKRWQVMATVQTMAGDRVVAGRIFASRKLAEHAANELRRDHGLPTYIQAVLPL